MVHKAFNPTCSNNSITHPAIRAPDNTGALDFQGTPAFQRFHPNCLHRGGATHLERFNPRKACAYGLVFLKAQFFGHIAPVINEIYKKT
jgi:hypothetical protein